MAIEASMPSTVVSAAATTGAGTTTSASKATTGIADNFATFLTLLTTQLQHQDPTAPLDTNQFTAQLVQFAGVEQQLRSNDQLSSLVKLQTTAQATQAFSFVGTTAVVDGSTATLQNGGAGWGLSVEKPATVTVSVNNSVGQAVYTGKFTLSAGQNQSFSWDGRGNDGIKWPDGEYTLVASGLDASGQPVAVSTEVRGIVESADLSKNPPVLSIGGQNFTVDKVKKVVRSTTMN